MVRIYVQSCVQPKIGCPRTLRATRRSRHRRRRRRRGERIIRLRGRKPVVHSVSIRGGGLRPAFCGMIRRRRSACSEHHRPCHRRGRLALAMDRAVRARAASWRHLCLALSLAALYAVIIAGMYFAQAWLLFPLFSQGQTGACHGDHISELVGRWISRPRGFPRLVRRPTRVGSSARSARRATITGVIRASDNMLRSFKRFA
jgi:hypothetical protein